MSFLFVFSHSVFLLAELSSLLREIRAKTFMTNKYLSTLLIENLSEIKKSANLIRSEIEQYSHLQKREVEVGRRAEYSL